MRAALALTLLAALTGCGSLQVPIVDMAGVDGVAYNRDVAACKDEVSSQLVSAGGAVGRCLERRGYRILRAS